jgi:hypothetical protein
MVRQLMRIILFQFCFFYSAFSIQITEIFYKGGPFVRSEERFIEIYNDSAMSFPLSNLVISVPRSDSVTIDLSVELGRFEGLQKDILTNSMTLPPYSYAVIITEDYNRYARLLRFASNTTLLKPVNKSFSGYSWADRISLLKLKTNGNVIFDCASYSLPADDAVLSQESLHLVDGIYSSAPLSPGINNSIYLYTEEILVRGFKNRHVWCRNPFCPSNAITMKVEFQGESREMQLIRENGSLFGTSFYPGPALKHGEDIVFKSGENTCVLRFLEERPLSIYYQKVLFNEIVSDPKTDYSGGGWTGNDGGGKIDSTDDWVELVNTANEPFNLSNCTFLYETGNSESIKSISFRTNSSSGNRSGVVSNYGYVVISPEGGIANQAKLSLYDGYPYLNGKILDEVSIENGDSSSGGDEAFSRMPNGAPPAPFRKQEASFCGNNGTERGFLWMNSAAVSNIKEIFLVDTNYPGFDAELLVYNDNDEEKVSLTNLINHFYGSLPISFEKGIKRDRILNVKNGEKNFVLYHDENPEGNIVIEFVCCRDGWVLPSPSLDFSKLVVYPNPLSSDSENTVVFANLPDQTRIFVVDEKGNVIGSFASSDNGAVLWKTSLRKGIYTAFFLREKFLTIFKKLLVR